MSQIPLTLVSIGDLDAGTVRAMIEAELARIAHDLEDRGEDGQVRKLKIEVAMKLDGNSVRVIAGAKAELPKYQTEPTFAKLQRVRGKAQLVFVPDSPQNPDQTTFTDADDRPTIRPNFNQE